MSEQRKITIGTSLGKQYAGIIDVPNPNYRTSDLLNSSNVFWRNPNDKCFENAIQLYDASLFVAEKSIYKNFPKIQIKIDEILYFFDEFESLGDEREKGRALKFLETTQEKPQKVHIITKEIANSFYDIEGRFFGLLKKKSSDKFIPLTEVKVQEVYKKEGKWFKREINLPGNYIGLSNRHIESAIIG
jgi:hypothetical protein